MINCALFGVTKRKPLAISINRAQQQHKAWSHYTAKIAHLHWQIPFVFAIECYIKCPDIFTSQSIFQTKREKYILFYSTIQLTYKLSSMFLMNYGTFEEILSFSRSNKQTTATKGTTTTAKKKLIKNNLGRHTQHTWRNVEIIQLILVSCLWIRIIFITL